LKNSLYLTRSASVAARRLGCETLVISPSSSALITLNEIASLIWEAADGTTPLDDIVTKSICPHFDVEPETALRDAAALVKNLALQGVLEVSDRPKP
jgi:coenzyme PQQ synthesis protein D (PqqD)